MGRAIPMAAVVVARLGGGTRVALCDAVLLVGLAAVFLANTVVAVVDPAAFTDLVVASPVGTLLGDDADMWVAPAIAVNDLCVGVALLAVLRLRRLRPAVLAWAGAWLMLVTLVKLTTLT